MDPTDNLTAWEHAPTQRAWSKQLSVSLLALVGWIALWIALLAVLVVFLSPRYTILFVPFLLYSFYRAFIQVFSIPVVFRTRRILREYPWRLYSAIPCGLTDRADVVGRQYGWFEFPNPAQPDEQLPMVFPRHWGVGWWHRRMAPRANPELKSQIDVVWLAGDPRFIGVIAASSPDGVSPRRFRFLHQQMSADGGGRSVSDWGATAEDIERGRRAGVRPARP
ncbi:hypothetical protein ACFC09_20175 [Streptomyces sp. NPDC056161]|uniref:hypothetical protein n=1 Tax=Streptomyces sp. NPDC056161 TaxID=3345732 RepID=UPI0035DFFC6A